MQVIIFTDLLSIPLVDGFMTAAGTIYTALVGIGHLNHPVGVTLNMCGQFVTG